jgi:hypothetical protein
LSELVDRVEIQVPQYIKIIFDTVQVCSVLYCTVHIQYDTVQVCIHVKIIMVLHKLLVPMPLFLNEILSNVWLQIKHNNNKNPNQNVIILIIFSFGEKKKSSFIIKIILSSIIDFFFNQFL